MAQGALGDLKKAWSLKTDGNTRIAVGGAAATGDYSVKVTAFAGSDSAVSSVTMTVTGTMVTAQELVLESNKNTLGGSVDLDELKVYTHAQAKDISAKIDHYYAHSVLEGDNFSPLTRPRSANLVRTPTVPLPGPPPMPPSSVS